MQQQLAAEQILPSHYRQALEQQGLGTPSTVFYACLLRELARQRGLLR